MIENINRSALRANWFVLAAAAIVAADFTAVSLDNWSNPALLEAGLLFDLSIIIPALYLWCYRARGKAAILRALALSCLGIWVAGHIVPSEHQQFLSTVGFVRYVGLAIVFVIEVKLVIMIYRGVFRGGDDANAVTIAAAKDAGMPEWAARLMAWEASLWHKGWSAVRRLFGRS
jgi:hypothetical protein